MALLDLKAGIKSVWAEEGIHPHKEKAHHTEENICSTGKTIWPEVKVGARK